MDRKSKTIINASSETFLTGDETKGISFRDLSPTSGNIEKLSKILNISEEELIIKNNWYFYEGEYYYYKKKLLAFRIMNELLGEYIAKYMSVPTIEYTLALDGSKIIGLLSKNFRVKGTKYLPAEKLTEKEKEFFRKVLKGNDINELRQLIDRIIVKDFYTCLTDRPGNVLVTKALFKRPGIAVSYDYELSFIDRKDALEPYNKSDKEEEFNTYLNPLFRSEPFSGINYIPIDYDYIKGMMEYDQYLIEQYEKMMGFDMGNALEEIQETKGLIIKDELIKFYKDYDALRKKELRDGIRKIKK